MRQQTDCIDPQAILNFNLIFFSSHVFRFIMPISHLQRVWQGTVRERVDATEYRRGVSLNSYLYAICKCKNVKLSRNIFYIVVII